jgi:hypothetical protein
MFILRNDHIFKCKIFKNAVTKADKAKIVKKHNKVAVAAI